jgi:hypothetical protein
MMVQILYREQLYIGFLGFETGGYVQYYLLGYNAV